MSGKVDFRAEGADIEKFITFCAKNGIEINNLNKNGYILSGKVSAENYKKFRKPAKSLGLKIRIIKKSGFIFILRKNRNKSGFVFGLLYAFMFIFIMNGFIWDINITGNDKIEFEEIINSAEKAGLRTGTLASKHFTQDIEWFILRENEGLASVEVNIQGSKAGIIVTERKEEENFKSDDDIPTNIIASKYGIIKDIYVFDGQPNVKRGEAVNKGDLLVSAVYEDSHKKLTLKHARAKVIAETDYETEIRFKFKQVNEEKGKNIGKTYKIIFLGKELNFGKIPDKTRVYSEEKIKEYYFFNVKLPIKLISTRFYDVKENTVTYNLNEAKKNAYDLLSEFEYKKMSEMDIISRKTNEKATEDEYIISAEYTVLMDIAKEEPILSDIPWENSDDMS